MGKRRETCFWEDVWVGGEPLKHKFMRLFHISLDKESKISELCEWGVWCWNGGGEGVSLGRRIIFLIQCWFSKHVEVERIS